MTLREKVQRRVAVSISPEIAAVADVSIRDLMQFAMYGHCLDDAQVRQIAHHFNIREDHHETV